MAKISKKRKAFEIVKSVYGNECDYIIKDIARYQKKEIEFDVLWTDEIHTAIGYERIDLMYDMYMLFTSDIDFGV